MGVKRTQADRSEATRAALVEAATRLFGERGYADVGTEEVVRAAGVTRGALYHHFTDKRDLFRAVFEQLEAEITQRIAEGALTQGEPLSALRAGVAMFLDVCVEPIPRRVALSDAPSVLGWDEWREIGSRYGLGVVQASLQAAMDAGQLAPAPSGPLGHLLLGALDEAAMMVARDPSCRPEVEATINRLLDGLATA